jgi:glutamyl-tRNA reductase
MIGVLGINHKTAAQEIREQFIFLKDEILPFTEYVQKNTAISEIVVLSTCNRTEIYYYNNKSVHQTHHNRLIDLLLSYKNAQHVPETAFYKYLGKEAVKHLFAVTSGIDSIVIGEDQIVGQVKDAYLFCTEATLTDAVLMRLFQKSFEASKRVRTETMIQQGPTSVSYVAVNLCSRIYKDLSDKSVLFVGSGETISLAMYNMKKRGVTKTIVTNRTFENALNLAKEYNGIAVEFEEFQKYLPQSDIIMVATGGQNHLIGLEDVKVSMAARNSNPQLYLDLSVPHNIDKSIGTLENVKLFGVDDLQEVLDVTSEKRKQSMDQALVIIDEVANEYMDWFESRTIRPIIQTIMTNMQQICAKELANYNADSSKSPEMLEDFSKRLTQKYVNSFIKNLKEISKNNTSSYSLNIINDLFMFEKNSTTYNEK